jgi:hypothetical protein
MVWEKMARDNLRISFLSAIDGWNRCGCEAAMAREEYSGDHEDGISAEAECAERLEEKWRQRKE